MEPLNFNEQVDKDIKQTIARLYESIQKANLSYGELAQMTGIAKSALHRYATGQTKKIPLDAVEKIAKATGVSAAYIMGWEERPDPGHSIYYRFPPPNITDDYTTFPIVGDIAAGYDHLAVESWDGEQIDIPNSCLRGHSRDDFFVLRVCGDSMYPVYHSGDKVLILKQNVLNYSGQVGAVIYDDDKASLKQIKFKEGEDWMELVPINPNVKPERIEGERLADCRILGIPKLLIRDIDD